ncbi:MAG: DNA-binding protein [Nitrospirae bacterium]|nr:DNA-binding protein [Nitrospirota bacterium]
MKVIKIALLMFFTFAVADAALYAEEPAQIEEKSHIGSVEESKKGTKYVYIKLKEDGKEVWLATLPEFLSAGISTGDKIEYLGGVEMTNFESKELGRTFDRIMFVTRLRILQAESQKGGLLPSAPGKDAAKKPVVTAPKAGEIAKAASGKYIKEVFIERNLLKDKEVIVRGKVMKVSKNILMKNWLTLQDGTGIAPDNKLVAVTTADANVGDVLTVKGILKTDVNLGSGYKYKVLIDDAVIEGK